MRKEGFRIEIRRPLHLPASVSSVFSVVKKGLRVLRTAALAAPRVPWIHGEFKPFGALVPSLGGDALDDCANLYDG